MFSCFVLHPYSIKDIMRVKILKQGKKKIVEKIKVAEQTNMELTGPEKHIKNTSTCGTIFTESQLKATKDFLNNQSHRKDPHVTG